MKIYQAQTPQNLVLSKILPKQAYPIQSEMCVLPIGCEWDRTEMLLEIQYKDVRLIYDKH